MMNTPMGPSVPKWPGIRVGVLSLFDLKGVWTEQQIRGMMPPAKTGGSLNETLLRGSTLMSSGITPSSSRR